MVQPRQILGCIRSERHRSEEVKGHVGTGKVACRRPGSIDGTLGDRLNGLKRRNQGAGFEHLHFDIATRNALDLFGKGHSGFTEQGQGQREGRGDLHRDLLNGGLCRPGVGGSRLLAVATITTTGGHKYRHARGRGRHSDKLFHSLLLAGVPPVSCSRTPAHLAPGIRLITARVRSFLFSIGQDLHTYSARLNPTMSTRPMPESG